MEVMEGINNGFDNTNVMFWKLGPDDRNIGEYIAVTDYPYVHEVGGLVVWANPLLCLPN